MADFTAKDVQALRQATGAGMMDAKRALTENDGDAEASAKWLREKGLTKAVEKASRANEQGAISIATAGTATAIVELKCETDYVAKSADFKALVDTLAQAVAAEGEAALATHQDAVDNLKLTLKENIAVGQVVRFQAPEGAILDTYVHKPSGWGVNAVMLELQGGDAKLAREISLHLAFTKPAYLSRDDVPAERVEEERQVLEAITRNEGKPEAALPKIVEGRLKGFFKEHVLLEQDSVQDNKVSIAQLLGDATITRFAQVVIGR